MEYEEDCPYCDCDDILENLFKLSGKLSDANETPLWEKFVSITEEFVSSPLIRNPETGALTYICCPKKLFCNLRDIVFRFECDDKTVLEIVVDVITLIMMKYRYTDCFVYGEHYKNYRAKFINRLMHKKRPCASDLRQEQRMLAALRGQPIFLTFLVRFGMCTLPEDSSILYDELRKNIRSFIQLPSQKIQPPVEYDALECETYWSSVEDLIPKTLLWENVENLLFQYWELLEMRSSLLKGKWNLFAENHEFENYLENYRKYGAYNL